MRWKIKIAASIWFALLLLTACGTGENALSPTSPDVPAGQGEFATVTNIIDGDTIDVQFDDGRAARVRYIGMDTPERDEACYAEATSANADLVDGRRVRMIKDTSETDRFGRLLRYVYVGDTFVNAALVERGYAVAARFPPDTQFAELFDSLEDRAREQNRGCL